jgi:hypothetical protein
MLLFVTHFDDNYLSRGLALIESIGSKINIVVFCHDSKTFNTISKLEQENVICLKLLDLESAFPELIPAKSERSTLEYYFLLSPYVVLYAIEILNSELAIYIDADTYFLSDVSLAIEQLDPDKAVGIIPHRFSERDLYMEKYGKYNVGWVSFRNSDAGMRVLTFWRDACLRSTSTIPTEGIFGDQKYLDYFLEVDSSVQVINHPGMNVAPWNYQNLCIIDGRLVHESEPLLFFHFSGLKTFSPFAIMGFAGYSKRPDRNVKKYLYRGYLDTILNFELLYQCKNAQHYSQLGLKGWLREIFFADLMCNLNIFKNFSNKRDLSIR